MELHLLNVNVCKWTYHVSFVILTAVLLKVQVLMAVTSGQPANGNTLLVDNLKHPRRPGSLNCCKVIRELMILYFEIFLRGFVMFLGRFIQDISGGISRMLGNVSCVK